MSAHESRSIVVSTASEGAGAADEEEEWEEGVSEQTLSRDSSRARTDSGTPAASSTGIFQKSLPRSTAMYGTIGAAATALCSSSLPRRGRRVDENMRAY